MSDDSFTILNAKLTQIDSQLKTIIMLLNSMPETTVEARLRESNVRHRADKLELKRQIAELQKALEV